MHYSFLPLKDLVEASTILDHFSLSVFSRVAVSGRIRSIDKITGHSYSCNSRRNRRKEAITTSKSTFVLVFFISTTAAILVMSGILSMSNRQIEIPPSEYVSNLGAGEHGVVFYTSKEEMRNIHFAFVKSGLENNWAVIYTAPESYSEELRNAMQNYGIDTKKFEEDGSLFLQKGEDAYKNPAKPDLDFFKMQANDIITYYLNKGKKGLRIATDLTSFFLPQGYYVSLFDAEQLFKPRMDLPITLICAYDAAIIPAIKDLDITFFYKRINKEWKQFVDAHSFAIYISKNKSITFTI